MKKRIAFRMDDVGAASKEWELHAKTLSRNATFQQALSFVTNIGPLKTLPILKGWGPYRELSADEWELILTNLRENDVSMTVGITACWVENDGSLTPFADKFPEQAKLIKEGVHDGLLEVANHGLTHCVVGRHLPRFWSSNRMYHREFWPWVSEKEQDRHIAISQSILSEYFERDILTFIPPGNVWGEKTLEIAHAHGLQTVSTSIYQREGLDNISFIDPLQVFAFHDRELVLNGISWLKDRIKDYQARGFQPTTVSAIKQPRP